MKRDRTEFPVPKITTVAAVGRVVEFRRSGKKNLVNCLLTCIFADGTCQGRSNERGKVTFQLADITKVY